jgi:hypothetical protein
MPIGIGLEPTGRPPFLAPLEATAPKRATRPAAATAPKRITDAAAALVPEGRLVDTQTYPISPDYIANWTPERAISEIIANAIDSDPDGFSVKWSDGVLEVVDDSSQGIGIEGMILGFSDKRDRKDKIGQFGEGLKIATLVLARSTKVGGILVETVGFAFIPFLKDQSTIGGLNIPSKTGKPTKVLSWNIYASSRPRGTRVRVICDEATANSAMGRFLQLSMPGYTPPPAVGRIILPALPTAKTSTSNGRSATSAEPRKGASRSTGAAGTKSVQRKPAGGDVFIGGVFVSHQRDLAFSYELSLETSKALQNRDRTVIDGWQIKRYIVEVITALEDEAIIIRYLDIALGAGLSNTEFEALTAMRSARQKRTIAEYGKAYFEGQLVFRQPPVSRWDDDTHAGEAALNLLDRGFTQFTIDGQTPYQADALLAMLGVPAATDIIKERAKKPEKTERARYVEQKDLTSSERTVLADGIAVIRAVWGDVALDRVRVYDEAYSEAGECLEWSGFYSTGNGDVAVKRDLLQSLDDLLKTLIHESGHRLAHRYPSLVELTYPDYADRSRGFEHVLGLMAARAAKQLSSGATLAEASEVSAERIAALAGNVERPLPPREAKSGFTYAWFAKWWHEVPLAGQAVGAVAQELLDRWAATNGIKSRSHGAALAKANYLHPAAPRRLCAGLNPGTPFQTALDVSDSLGLSAGVVWWATEGARLAFGKATAPKRSRRFPPRYQADYRAATAELTSRGGIYAETAVALTEIAEGLASLDVSTFAWALPIEALVKAEAQRVGVDLTFDARGIASVPDGSTITGARLSADIS